MQGHSDSALSERGIAQARAVAVRLSRCPIHAIYSSDLTRALNTAQIIAQAAGSDVTPIADLREKSFGQWEGLTEIEIKSADPLSWHQYFVERRLDFAVPGGETWDAVQTRIVNFLQRILADHPGQDETVLLVGHGGSLRAAIIDALQAPPSALLRMRLDNASVSRLEYHPERGGRVALLNDTSHLEANFA